MAKKAAFNATEVPVVIDDEGHTIAGLAHGEVDTTKPEVKQALEAGRLVLTDTKGDS